jgi:hypothetical protein
MDHSDTHERDATNGLAGTAASLPVPQVSTVFTNHKAGMDQVDKSKVQKVVYEMSKDSAHYQNELRKEVRGLAAPESQQPEFETPRRLSI